MKSFSLLILLGIFICKDSLSRPFPVRKHVTFVYVVKKYEESYQLHIKIDKFKKGELAFHFLKTNPEQSKGTYAISPSAMDSAMAMTVLFKSGEKILDHATACMLSKKAFNELKETKKTKMVLDGPITVDFVLLQPPYQLNYFDTKNDGNIQIGKKIKTFKLLLLKSTDLKNPIEMAILDNKRCPWFFYVNIGEKMWLQEIIP